jgi:hypothetical protein
MAAGVSAGAALVRAEILAFVARSTPRFDPSSVPGDFDLLAEGVIDSLGFLQLLAELEWLVGGPVELDGLDPERMGVVGALSDYIARKYKL